MKKLILCNYLFIKRCLKRTSFIILLLLIPILCMVFKTNIEDTKISIKTGLYIESEDNLTNKICNNLKNNYESVTFERCSSLDELTSRVASGDYECGYVFNSDFSEKVYKNKTNNLVTVYKSPGTLTDAITDEYVFSEVFAEYGFNELAEFISSQKIFTINDIDALRSTLRPEYDYYMAGNDTFSFEYINADNEAIDNSSLLSSYVLLSVRGIITLFIMFAAFIGTFNLYKDSKTGIFNAFNSKIRPFCKMSEIFSLTLLAGILGMSGVYLSGLSDGIWLEIFRILLYSIICTLYCYILYKIIPNSFAFAALIPVLVLGSIIFCPIFMDVSEIIPIVKYIAWLFPPKYYFAI